MTTKILFKRRAPGAVRRGIERAGTKIKKAGIFAGVALLAMGLMLTPKSLVAKKLQEKKIDPSEQVWAYPNFSNAGTLGNPALWPLTGKWGFILFGRNNDNVNNLSLLLNTEITNGVYTTLTWNSNFGAAGNSENLTVGLAGPLGNGFFLGGEISTGFGNGNTSVNGNAGLMHVLNLRKFLLRSGITHSFGNNTTRFEVEARFLAAMLEITLSTNASFRFDGDNSGYLSQNVGAQVRWKFLLASFGIDAKDGHNTKTHARVFVNDRVMVDWHLTMDGSNFKSTSLGTTIMF